MIINDLSNRLGIEDKSSVYRILKSVLHTIRECITTEESLTLMTKLPLFAKLVYAEDWKLRKMKDLPKPKTIQEFVAELKENHDRAFLGYDFANNEEIERDCRMVLGFLLEMMAKRKDEHVLPERIEKLFKTEERRFINKYVTNFDYSLN
jgi:uncharacterized protein (DUF2267 family)